MCRDPRIRVSWPFGIALAWAAAAAGAAGAAGAVRAPYPNVQVNLQSNEPEETSIAVNPTGVSNVIGVAQIPSSSACRVYATFDGGAGWDDAQLPGSFELGDPSVVFDREGSAYYGYIGTFSHSGIFINKSTDGGESWKAQAVPVIEHDGDAPFEDKPYPVCDWTASPYHGALYVCWTQFDHYGSALPSDSSRILCARSTNGGASFLAPMRVSDRGGDARDSDDTVEGAVPAVGPDGTVYVAWAGPRGIEFDRSVNGGIFFGADRIISDLPGGWDFDVPGIYRCNGLPTTKADFSFGPYRGRIYVCWSDQRYGDTDVFLLHSDDGGASWAPRARVNTDPPGNGRDQFFPWIDVDPVTGVVYVVFYDRREHADLATEVYLATSFDGGETFTDERISDTPFIPDPNRFFGDYIGISAYAGTVRPLWVRMDAGHTSLWTARIDPDPAGLLYATLPGSLEPGEDASGDRWLAVRPNPVRKGAEIWFGPAVGEPRDVAVFDARGRRVAVLDPGTPLPGRSIRWDGRDSRGRPLQAGVYFLRGAGTPPIRFTVLR